MRQAGTIHTQCVLIPTTSRHKDPSAKANRRSRRPQSKGSLQKSSMLRSPCQVMCGLHRQEVPSPESSLSREPNGEGQGHSQRLSLHCKLQYLMTSLPLASLQSHTAASTSLCGVNLEQNVGNKMLGNVGLFTDNGVWRDNVALRFSLFVARSLPLEPSALSYGEGHRVTVTCSETIKSTSMRC